MKTTHFLPLSHPIKWITLLALIIIIVAMIYMAYQWYTTKQVMLLVTFVIVAIALLSCMVLIPRKLTVTQEAINIHLLAWRITVPADEIVKVEHYPHGIQSSRIAGAGVYLQGMWQTFVFDYRPNGCLHHHPQKQNAHRGKHSRQQRFQCNLQSSREKLNMFTLLFA